MQSRKKKPIDPFAETDYEGGMEVIDNGQSEVVEEYLEFPEEEIIRNGNYDLVRMDMNIIEYPLFSKNKRRKINQSVIYYFNNRKDKYIEVKPIAGSTIPGEFEERVFISLIKIMRKNGYGKKFCVSVAEILENLNIENRKTRNGLYKNIKEAMIKLTETSYIFKNSLYSSQLKGLIEDRIITSIMNIRIISKKGAKGNDAEYFKDGRVTEIYVVSMSDHFYNNIIRKGYLVYDSNALLQISTSTARGIYLLITKWRFDNLYIRQKIITLLKRIPLRFDRSNIAKSIKAIENSCQELKERGLIKDFMFLKETTWEEAEIEFYFEDEHNQIKQLNFFEDKNSFNNLTISFTEEKKVEEVQEIGLLIQEILELLPEKAKNLKTMPSAVKDAIKNYGIDNVKKAARYTKLKATKSIKGFFLDSLSKDWISDFYEEEKLEKELPIKDISEEENRKKDEREALEERYNHLSQEEQREIEELAYNNYIEKCRANGPIQKRTFEKAKKILIIEYLMENKYFEEKTKVPRDKDASSHRVLEKKELDMKTLKVLINRQVEFYASLFELTEEETIAFKVDIGKEILFAEEEITETLLTEAVKKVIAHLKK